MLRSFASVRYGRHFLHTTSQFDSMLPEFSQCQEHVGKDKYADAAFKYSLIDNQTDLKFWKTFREDYFSKDVRMTPRELSRMKFALTHSGVNFLKFVKWGKAPMHQHLEDQVREFLPHMNVIEVLSALFGFQRNKNENLYQELLLQLQNEIPNESDLGVLSLIPYVISKSAIHTRYLNQFRPKHITNDRTLEMIKLLAPRFTERVMEMSDDQFATLAAGIANAKIPLARRLEIEELVDAMEKDCLYRRIERMSLENLVDVTNAFVALNLGTDELFNAIYARIDKLGTLPVDSVLDWGNSLLGRDRIDDDLIGKFTSEINSRFSELRIDYSGKLSEFIMRSLTKDEALVSNFIGLIESTAVPISKYYKVQIAKTYIEKNFTNLMTDSFAEKCDQYAIKFLARRMIESCPEHKTMEYENILDLLQDDMKYTGMPQFVYNNETYTDFGFMPQKVGINIALPTYGLVGKVGYDHRLIKEPKRKFKILNSFKTRGEYLRLHGFKIIDLNYVDVMENVETAEERRQMMRDLLEPLGVTEIPQVSEVPNS